MAMPPRSSSTRARRRAPRKGDVTEQAILDTAERLLADRSLASIGIDELAAGAGISRPSFYFYFESREAVLRALAERITDELYRTSEVWLRRSDESPADAVRRTIEANLALWRQYGAVMRATVNTRDTDAELRRFWDAVARRFVEAGGELVAVTDFEDAPLAKIANQCIYVATGSASYVDSPTVVAAVLHVLATLTTASAKGARRRLGERDRLNTELGLYVS